MTCMYCLSKIILKIDSEIYFFIEDIISYCYNEGGVMTYEIYPFIINKINLKDVSYIREDCNTNCEKILNYIIKDEELDLNGKVFIPGHEIYDNYIERNTCSQKYNS
jgi:hypothetical protein